MRASFVVPLDPLPDLRLGLREAVKTVLRDTFLFQAAEEPFDDPVLRGRLRGDELLSKPVVPTRCPETSVLEEGDERVEILNTPREHGADPIRSA